MYKKYHKCVWCGEPFGKNGLKRTKEHMTPKSMGGGQYSNIGASHAKCNKERGIDTAWKPYYVKAKLMPQNQKAWIQHMKLVMGVKKQKTELELQEEAEMKRVYGDVKYV